MLIRWAQVQGVRQFVLLWDVRLIIISLVCGGEESAHRWSWKKMQS